MASKKVWKARAKSVSAQLNTVTMDLGMEREELERTRTDLVRARADLEEMRTAGRCLFSATQGEVDPRSSTPLVEQIVVLQSGLAHAHEHWLSVDPL